MTILKPLSLEHRGTIAPIFTHLIQPRNSHLGSALSAHANAATSPHITFDGFLSEPALLVRVHTASIDSSLAESMQRGVDHEHVASSARGYFHAGCKTLPIISRSTRFFAHRDGHSDFRLLSLVAKKKTFESRDSRLWTRGD